MINANEVYVIYALTHLGFLAQEVNFLRREGRFSLVYVILVTAALFYDNAVLALGSYVGMGPLLYRLSVPRYAFHQLLLPLVIPFSFDLVRRAGAPWAARPWAAWGVWILALFAAAMGGVTRLVNLQLEPATTYGVLRYAAIGTKGPPVATILSMLFVLAMGVSLWRHGSYPGRTWLFVVTLLLFVVEGLPIGDLRLIVGSGLEVLFIGVLMITYVRVRETGRSRGYVDTDGPTETFF